jgi:predicted NAD-dependent protein-ADP-ribosyltransferase YbiA (DUF1768 family)
MSWFPEDGSATTFTKVSLPFGCLGNMSPHPIGFDFGHKQVVYPTAEHLFQVLRFSPDSPIRDEIRDIKSPMAAKWHAKKYAHLMTVEPRSDQDLFNMRFVLLCKLREHPIVKETLLSTGNSTIIEDCSNRPQDPLFWGAKRVVGNGNTGLNDGEVAWFGENVLGKLWMIIRDELRAK